MQGDSTRGWKVAAPIVFGLCALLLVTSAKESEGDDLRGSDILELSDLVRAKERKVAELNSDVDSLNEEIATITTDHDDTSEPLNQQISQLSPLVGLAPVQGPGVTVALDDAPLPKDQNADVNIEDYLVHQQDLEGVINALWAGGAEAVTVMDQRITATSTIRCVGSVLLLHGKTYYPPYTIKAIGAPDALKRSLTESDQVAQYRKWAELLGLRYDVTSHKSLSMSAYSQNTTDSSDE